MRFCVRVFHVCVSVCVYRACIALCMRFCVHGLEKRPNVGMMNSEEQMRENNAARYRQFEHATRIHRFLMHQNLCEDRKVERLKQLESDM